MVYHFRLGLFCNSLFIILKKIVVGCRMTLIEAKEKVIKEITYFKNKKFAIWTNGKDYFIQEYIQDSPKVEFFGHVYKVDFDKKELEPVL